jgi:molecular chaperone DnaK
VSENSALEAMHIESMAVTPVLALDLGTSNTYVTKCPGDKEEPVGVDFGDGRDGIATAILYRNGKAPLIGNAALEEFGDAGPARDGYSIHTQFKPDLATSATARGYARDFLTALLDLARRQNKDITPLGREVIFGLPSQASGGYRDALLEVAREAGYGSVKTVAEPKGALYFHIQRGDITPLEGLKGTLVVDFGGGTCDFALMAGGEVKHSWGDMDLGGRLFDDLFYQWFIEQNREAVALMRKEGAEFFVLAVRCRELKEKFSLAMALDQHQVFRKAVGEYGRIGDVTWEGFRERARHYRPSPTFAEYLRATNPGASQRLLADEQGTDLLEWFRQTLRRGLEDEQVRGQQLACVILTGGSSAWPFVGAILTEELEHIGPPPRLVQSDRPYATVSQGLAIIPAVQRHFAATREALRKESPGFVSERVGGLIERRMSTAAERIAEAVAADLFDGAIAPILHRFRQTGGSVAELKAEIASAADRFQPQIESIVKTRVAEVLAGVAADTTELMQAWFREHRLTVGPGLVQNGSPPDLAEGLRIADPDVYGEISDAVLALSSSIVVVLTAVLSGGAGTALIASGPVGLLVGALIGLTAGAIAVRFGVDEAKRRAEEWQNTPVWIISRALTDNKIARLRQDMKDQVADKVKSQSESAKHGMEAQIEARVEREIASLSDISQL